MKKLCSLLLVLLMLLSLVPSVLAADGAEARVTVTLTSDAKKAIVTGDYTGLYVRIALVLVNNGESGLYITPCQFNDDGTITIPELDLPGISVTGVNVALVLSPDDVTSPNPNRVDMDFAYITDDPVTEPDPIDEIPVNSPPVTPVDDASPGDANTDDIATPTDA